MNYRRNQFIIAGSFWWWGVTLIIVGTLFWWGLTVLQWTWLGTLVIGLGIVILSAQIVAIVNRSKLRRVILQELQATPEASINTMSTRTGISRNDVRAIVLDLKATRQFIGKFSTKTGQLKRTSLQTDANNSEIRSKYCQYCGTYKPKESALFCPYCGAKFQ